MQKRMKGMKKLTILKTPKFSNSLLSDDEVLQQQIECLDQEVQLSLNEARNFLKFIQSYESKLILLESRLLEIRSLIEKGLFNKSLDIELRTLINRLQKMVDPKVKLKIKNRLQVIQNFEEYSAKKEEQLEWKVIRSDLDSYKNQLQ